MLSSAHPILLGFADLAPSSSSPWPPLRLTAFLRQSHRYLTKQLKSLDSDDWRFASSEDRDVNTLWNQDRLFVPATTLDMAAGKRGWGNERDDMGDATMEIVGEEGEEVWGRGGR